MEQFSAARNRPPPLSNSRPFSIWSISIPADDFLLCDARAKRASSRFKIAHIIQAHIERGELLAKDAHTSVMQKYILCYTVWQSKRIVRLPRLKASRNRNLAGCCDQIKFAAPISMLLAGDGFVSLFQIDIPWGNQIKCD
jgi:hypothetical protein